MTWRLTRIFMLASLLIVGRQSQADDAYYEYVADFYLHESHQARNPNQIIRYADGENGALLESLLEPTRVKAVLNTYLESMKRGEQVPEVPKLLSPLSARYDGAFKKEPRTYEREFLDSVEASVEVMAIASRMTNASPPPSPTNKVSGVNVETQKAIAEVAKMSREFSAMVYRVLAKELRDRVAKGMFSESAAKRALAIADRVSSQ
ncbi:MAG: hypothetical protein OEL88_06920 [Sterolibacteriaceae bacterium MAG5]|nr:hypothetical protein [Candidatus Nitricoxidireducens bremensis]